jgi:hypothetical protein
MVEEIAGTGTTGVAGMAVATMTGTMIEIMTETISAMDRQSRVRRTVVTIEIGAGHLDA